MGRKVIFSCFTFQAFWPEEESLNGVVKIRHEAAKAGHRKTQDTGSEDTDRTWTSKIISVLFGSSFLQVGPASFEHAESEFLLYSSSLQTHLLSLQCQSACLIWHSVYSKEFCFVLVFGTKRESPVYAMAQGMQKMTIASCIAWWDILCHSFASFLTLCFLWMGP